MFNRAVTAFRKGIHRKSNQSALQNDEDLYSTTEDEEDDGVVVCERLSIRSTTTSCSFRTLEHSQSGSSGILGGSLQSTSEGILGGYFR